MSCQEHDAKIYFNYDHNTNKDDNVYDNVIHWTDNYHDRKMNDGSEHTEIITTEYREKTWSGSLTLERR